LIFQNDLVFCLIQQQRRSCDIISYDDEELVRTNLAMSSSAMYFDSSAIRIALNQ